MRSRVLASCFASATLVATLFAAQVSYACSMTGRRQSHCCCPTALTGGGEAPASRITMLCCERTISQDRAPAAVQQRDVPTFTWTSGPLLAVLAAPQARDPQRVVLAPVARGPPSGPPLYVRTCRYLI